MTDLSFRWELPAPRAGQPAVAGDTAAAAVRMLRRVAGADRVGLAEVLNILGLADEETDRG